MAPWLPPDILRRPKQGFQIPLADWFRGHLGTFAHDTWHGSRAASSGYLQPAVVERLFAQHRRGEIDHSRILYAVTVFALWWANERAYAPRAAA